MTSSPTDMKPQAAQHGFSLLEMAIVLVVFGLLASGLLKGLSAHREQTRINEARQQLATVREALIGFALANGRLPCPAKPELATGSESAGSEALSCIPDCLNADATCTLRQGILPWQTLGLEATDPWGNRLTYFADKNFTQPLSQANKDAGLRSRITLDLKGSANIQERAGTNTLSEIPVVVICHGSRAFGAFNGSGLRRAGATGDEAENADDDLTFIARLPDDRFDDLLTWVPTTVLKARLASVGKLP